LNSFQRSAVSFQPFKKEWPEFAGGLAKIGGLDNASLGSRRTRKEQQPGCLEQPGCWIVRGL
jgi:hypothetical protein